MKASGVVLDLNEKTNNACGYIRDFPHIEAYSLGEFVIWICNFCKLIKTCSLNIQQVLKDKVPGKSQYIFKFFFGRQLDYITRINIRWDIYIVLQNLQDAGQETMDQGSRSAK